MDVERISREGTRLINVGDKKPIKNGETQWPQEPGHSLMPDAQASSTALLISTPILGRWRSF